MASNFWPLFQSPCPKHDSNALHMNKNENNKNPRYTIIATCVPPVHNHRYIGASSSAGEIIRWKSSAPIDLWLLPPCAARRLCDVTKAIKTRIKPATALLGAPWQGHGRRKEGGLGPILEFEIWHFPDTFSTKTGCFLSSGREKWNFTIFVPALKKSFRRPSDGRRSVCHRN